jgi:hypothetical protein
MAATAMWGMTGLTVLVERLHLSLRTRSSGRSRRCLDEAAEAVFRRTVLKFSKGLAWRPPRCQGDDRTGRAGGEAPLITENAEFREIAEMSGRSGGGRFSTARC